MKIAVRSDLGGYAAQLPGYTALEGTKIEAPFVLLTGPNGSGKTALLRGIRASLGIYGERGGHPDEEGNRPADPGICGDDLGKLAAYTGRYRGGKDEGELPRETPCIVDIRSLGWTGQRSWLFDSRGDTTLASSGSFDRDIQYQVGLIAGGASRVSHGQLLRTGWHRALRFALGGMPAKDPYDKPSELPPSRRALWKAVTPDGLPRPEERWLFLDEPEAALDAETLFCGLAMLIQTAAAGRLRVFCSSHSPLFAAGLGDHPNVQVVDLAPTRSWYAVQKRSLQLAAQPEMVNRIATEVAGNLRKAEEAEAVERTAALRKKMGEKLQGIKPKERDLLVAALAHPKKELPATFADGSAVPASLHVRLERRDLVIFEPRRRGDPASLNRRGIEVAEYLAKTPKKGAAA